MNGRRRRTKHRMPMSADSKKRLIAVLIWAAAALFAVLIALFIGNMLGDASEIPPRDDDTLHTYAGEPPNAADARYFELYGHTETSLHKSAASLQNGTEISIILRSSGGRAPNYKSEVSYAVGGSMGGLFDLSTFVNALDEKDIRVIGCFYSSFATVSNEVARAALIDYEAALLAEACRAGVREILVFGLPTDDGGITEASKLFMLAREKAPNIVLGAAIGKSTFDSGNIAYVLATYYSFANFCAFDSSGAFSTATTAAQTVSKYAYYFERYPLRVLIEEIGNRDAQVSELKALGVKDIQSIPVFTSN